jgi:hypothetical protein
MVSQVNETAVGKNTGSLTLHIRKRPWYVWLLRAVWVVWILAWLEFAIGSKQEIEPQAFSVAVKVLIVSVLLGLGLYFWRLREERKGSGAETLTD